MAGFLKPRTLLPASLEPDRSCETSSIWEPEFSLGQLYNKSLFLQGFYNEINDFARCILDDTPPTRGTLAQARAATGIFEAFAQGPGKTITL